MEFAVLVKVVPAAESATFDPVRKTIRRDEGERFVNPFDQRALRVALDLRRPGESVTVVSMGPPSSEPAVEETLRTGVDRAVFVSDPALAGSDTLVTARVLARVLTDRPAGLVLAGKWTTDAETGQVPAEVAELLGVPIVSAARSLQRSEEGSRFEATVETDTGSARVAFAAPAVVSVGEKIAKPAKSPGPGGSAVGPVERVDAARLGFAPRTVGLAGSPTVVGDILDVAPGRRPVVFGSGSVESRVREGLAALGPLWAAAHDRPSPRAGPARTGPTEGTVIVLASDERGRLDRSVLGVVSEVRRAMPRRSVLAALATESPEAGSAGRLAAAGADRVVWLPAESGITSRSAAAALDELLSGTPDVAAVVLLSRPFGREVAGRLAARRGLGLTGDAVSIEEDPAGHVQFLKPALGGGVLARISSRTRPALATVRPGVFEAREHPPPPRSDPVRGPALRGDPSIRWTGWEDEISDGLPDPDVASIVASVGIGGVPALPAIRDSARRWGAALVGTRRVVDAGHLPVSRQVGLTGRWVSPRLGILLGVRGAANHLIGWRRAGVLLAVNPDPEAPVFSAVDVGVVARCEEALAFLDGGIEALPRAEGR